MARRFFYFISVVVLIAAIVVACGNKDKPTPTPNSAKSGDTGATVAPSEGGVPASAMQIAQTRGLTPDDIDAALKTYMPSGKWDEYYMFASGGHSGNMIVIGIPSMRILKNIAVFTPESWQGYGYGA